MTPAELKRIGRALFGKKWQKPLAALLSKHRVTIWRWSNKTTPIPEEDAKLLRGLVAERS